MADRPESVVVFGLTPDAWKRAMIGGVLVLALNEPPGLAPLHFYKSY